jgi:hypothetical protein
MSREAGVQDISMPTARESGKEFVRLLKSLLGSMGQQARYSEGRVDMISKAGHFSLSLQIELCDRFMIIPDQAGEFLSLLHDELRDALRNGMPLSGAWGSVVVDGDDISYRLTPPSFVESSGFTRAKEIR